MAPPNLILLITDQQRETQHWPTDPDWLADLMPAEAELRRTALTFERGYCASAMCSPSRASLLTGRWPAEHGVTLTHTGADGGARPKPQHRRAAMRQLLDVLRTQPVPRRVALRGLRQSLTQAPADHRDEPELDPATPNLARVLETAGYRTYIKGKWHLSKPVDEAAGWSAADRDAIADRYGIHDWEPPDAGENTDPHHFGGGTAGTTGEGWDEDYVREVEAFLADPPPSPWALIVSLVNPHDVLGYPDSFEEGGFSRADWADLDAVQLPPTVDEDMSDKPYAHALQKAGQTSFIGPLKDREAQLDYVRFYAHLHRVVDEKVGRVLTALGDPDDPASLRHSTVILRTSDHGEMGLSHGGLRQKMFTAYEEAIHVPFVVSSPALFPEARTTDALASLCDVVPTLAGLAGADVADAGVRGRDLGPVLARHAVPGTVDATPADTVQEAVHFTYDDHKSGSAFTDVAAPPNRIRAVRTADAMYAVYVDPEGRADPQYELYDTATDPHQVDNLVDRLTGRVLRGADEPLRAHLHALLHEAMATARTTPPPAAGLRPAT
jgi:choline-sulfatase